MFNSIQYYREFPSWLLFSFEKYLSNHFKSCHAFRCISFDFKNIMRCIYYDKLFPHINISCLKRRVPQHEEYRARNAKQKESWGFNNLRCECNEFGKVTLIFCKTCQEYYSLNEIYSPSILIKPKVDEQICSWNKWR